MSERSEILAQVRHERWVRCHDHPVDGPDDVGGMEARPSIAYIRSTGRAHYDHHEVCTVYGCNRDPQQDARADIIAAAPDLLAACKAVLDYYASDYAPEIKGESSRLFGLMAAQINAAIAKAEGRAEGGAA